MSVKRILYSRTFATTGVVALFARKYFILGRASEPNQYTLKRQILRGAIAIRTHHIHRNLQCTDVPVFLLTVLGRYQVSHTASKQNFDENLDLTAILLFSFL